MFTAASFMVDRTWRQPKCPLIQDWIKKIWSIHAMECSSAMRKNEILAFATTWMDLENIKLSKISQSEKANNHVISLIYGI